MQHTPGANLIFKIRTRRAEQAAIARAPKVRAGPKANVTRVAHTNLDLQAVGVVLAPA